MTDLGGDLDLGGGSGTCRDAEVHDECIANGGVILELGRVEGILGDVAEDGVVGIIEYLDVAAVGGGHSRWPGAGNGCYKDDERTI